MKLISSHPEAPALLVIGAVLLFLGGVGQTAAPTIEPDGELAILTHPLVMEKDKPATPVLKVAYRPDFECDCLEDRLARKMSRLMSSFEQKKDRVWTNLDKKFERIQEKMDRAFQKIKDAPGACPETLPTNYRGGAAAASRSTRTPVRTS